MVLEEVLSNSVSEGFQDAARKIMAGNATNETVASLNTVLTTKLQVTDTLNNTSFNIFIVTFVVLAIYYLVCLIFKDDVADKIKERYFSLENKSSRAPGLILIFMGDKLFAMSQILVIALTMTLAGSILIDSMFPTPSSLFNLGFLGYLMFGFMSFFNILLIMSFFAYAVYLVAGLTSINTLGLALFFNPNSDITWRLIRLFWANQFFPLVLMGIIWFIYLVLEIFSFPSLILAVAPIFTSALSCILLYILHTVAWDWDIGTSKNRYRGNINWARNKIGWGVAVSTGNAAAITAMAATTANNGVSGDESSEAKRPRGVRRRRKFR